MHKSGGVCVILILVIFFDRTPGQVLCSKLGLCQFPAGSWLPRVAIQNGSPRMRQMNPVAGCKISRRESVENVAS